MLPVQTWPPRNGPLSLLVAVVGFLSLSLSIPAASAYAAFPASDANRTFDTTFRITAPPGSVAAGLVDTPFYLYNYVTPNYQPARIKRAVIALHGLGRDAWGYFDQTNQALRNATSRRDVHTNQTRLEHDDVVIMAPLFMNNDDRGAFPYDADEHQPTTSALVWSRGKWAEGADSIYPLSVLDAEGDEVPAPRISSFEALDEVVRFFADSQRFPQLNTIIIAGHSLGAQMAQRYAVIGSVPSGTTPVHFVVANPGSFAYLSDWRPRSYQDCRDTFDAWKFGLSSYGQRYLSDFIAQSLDTSNEIESVVARYRRRIVSYLFGLADFGLGDVGCEARAQGEDHISRGRFFVQHLSEMDGGFPTPHTVEYVPGVAHDGLGMFTSQAGLERLFYINLDGTEVPTAVGNDDRAIKEWLAEQMIAAGATARPSFIVVVVAAAAATAMTMVATMFVT